MRRKWGPLFQLWGPEGSWFRHSSPLTAEGLLLMRNLAQTHLNGYQPQFRVNSPGIFFGTSGSPGASSSTGFFLGFVFTLYSFYPTHLTKGELQIQFLPRLLNECASSVTERGNGLVKFAYWLSIFMEQLLLARQGSRCWGYSREKYKNFSCHGVDILGRRQMLHP